MRKKLIVFLAVGIFLFGAARPAFAAGGIFQNFTNTVLNFVHQLYFALPGDKPGRVVVLQSLQTMQNVHSFQLSSTLNIDVESQQHPVATIQVALTGPVQVQNILDPHSYMQAQAIDVHASMQGSDIHLSADTRSTSDAFFIKLNEAPVLPFLSLDSLNGKWLKLTTGSADKTSAFTSDQQQKLQDAFWQLINTAQFSSAKKEKQDDHDVFVVDVTIPQAALTTYLATALAVTSQPKNVDKTYPLQANTASAFIEKIGDLHLTLWVDRDSFYLRHVEFPLTYPLNKTTASAITNDALVLFKDVDTLKFMVNASFDHQNDPVQIDIPQDAQDIQSAFQNALPSSSSNQFFPSQLPVHVAPSELPQLSPVQRSLLQKYQRDRQSQGGQ